MCHAHESYGVDTRGVGPPLGRSEKIFSSPPLESDLNGLSRGMGVLDLFVVELPGDYI